MTAAREAEAEGAEDGLVIWAEAQDAGRGRRGREWSSPPGNLYCSLLLRPNCRADQAAELSFVTALSVWSSVASLLPRTVSVQCKWPNDILVEGKKVCGILTEMSAELDKVSAMVLGIGVNVYQTDFPSEFKKTAVSLEMACEGSVSRNKILRAMLCRLDWWYAELRNKAFDHIVDRWKALSCTLGREVVCKSGDVIIKGKAVDVASDGSLVVRNAGGMVQRIYAGDVTLVDRGRAK